jgi:hypothetical protein
LDSKISRGKYYIACDEDLSEDNSDSSSDQIINTKINQGGDAHQQIQDENQVTKELHQAFLESESFPFEIGSDIKESLKRRLRERRWFQESMQCLETAE